MKKVFEKSRQSGKYKKENLKAWSEEAIDTLSNCLQSHECLSNVTSVHYKHQGKMLLALEEVDLSMQEYDMSRYDYQKMNSSLRQILERFDRL